jgi:2-(3-amino-3-carboxypropyl)histidine synthase
MDYDLELDRVVSEITKAKAKRVCIQLPDGLKPRAGEITKEIESKTRSEVLIWAGSCFGACDTPQGLEKLGVDMLVQWGHAPWK